MRETIFWGATGQAKVLREALPDDVRLVALFDNSSDVAPPFADVPLFRGDKIGAWCAERTSRPTSFLVAIGGERGETRLNLHANLVARGLEPLTLVHKSAYVAAGVTLAPGCQVLAHATLCVDVVLGRECIVNTAASIDHECRVGDGVHVGPGAHLAGCVEVGDGATIYTGATVAPRVRIGERAVVGAGAVVLHDVPPATVVVGNPARFLKGID